MSNSLLPRVVGHAKVADSDLALLWQVDSRIELTKGLHGWSSSIALDVNDAGQAVGYATTPEGEERGMLWSGDSVTGLAGLPQCPQARGRPRSRANAINAIGYVVGRSSSRSAADPAAACRERDHAFVRDTAGGTNDLGTLVGYGGESEALGINAVGQIVGWSQSASGDKHAFLYTEGRMYDLGTLGGRRSRALDINDTGDVVGYADDRGGRRHGFVYAAGVMIDLGTLEGAHGESQGRAINALGQVVGTTTFPGSAGGRHAFLYDAGRMLDLNSQLPTGSAWELVSAEDINDGGQIVGQGLHHGALRAFLLSPAPTPDPESDAAKPKADLSISVSAAPNPVQSGSNLTYTLTARNNGPAGATSITVRDTLPATTSYVSCTATGGGICGGTGQNRTITFASMGSGASATITLMAGVSSSVTHGTVISNRARIEASGGRDPTSGNNVATATVTVSNLADLSLAKGGSPNPVQSGSNLTYQLTLLNNGPTVANSITVRDTLPAPTSFVSCAATAGGVCAGTGGNRTVTFPSLSAGASATITLVAAVGSSVADGTLITNRAHVASGTPDPNAGNNTGSASVTVSNPSADLSLAKGASPDPVAPGADLTYTITLTNNGPTGASSITVRDTLPATTVFVSCASTAGGSCGGAGNERTVSFSSLGVGTSATITLVSTVGSSVADGTLITNRAHVAAGTPDPTAGDNTASASATVSVPFVGCSGGGCVFYVSTLGSDSWDGLSPSRTSGTTGPWRTLGHALGAASPIAGGDTVRVLGGSYNEIVRVEKSGAPGRPIVVMGHGDGTATIRYDHPIRTYVDGSGNTVKDCRNSNGSPDPNRTIVIADSLDRLIFRNLTIDGGVWVAGTDPALIQAYKGDHTVPGRTAARDSVEALGVWAWLGARTGMTIDYADSISFQNVKVLTRGFYVAVAQDFELRDSEVGVIDCGIGAAVWFASFVQFANVESTYIHDTGTPDAGDAHFMVEGIRIGGGGAFNYIFNNYARNMGGPGHCFTVDVGPSWNTFKNNTCEIAQNGFHDQGKPWGNDWIANLARNVRASSFQLVSPGKANENGNSPPDVNSKHVQYKTAFCNESRAGANTDEDLAAYLVGNSRFFDNYWRVVTVHDTLAAYWGDWGNQWEGTASPPMSNDTLGFHAHCGPTGSSLPVAGGQGGGQSAPSIPRVPTDLGFTPSRNR